MAHPETCSCTNMLKYAAIFVGVILVVLQTSCLSFHLEKLSYIDGIGHVGWLVVPVLVFWACVLKYSKTPLPYLGIVWALYAFQLAVFFAFIFGNPEIRDKLSRNEDGLWLPTCCFKISILLTPAINLLFIYSASDESSSASNPLKELCFTMAIDRCDDIAALFRLIKNELKDSPSIKDDGYMVVSIISIVALSLLFSTLDLAENELKVKVDENGDREYMYYEKRPWVRAVKLLVKLVLAASLFCIRLMEWLYYDQDASIFIAKSVIFIVMYIYQLQVGEVICRIYKESR